PFPLFDRRAAVFRKADVQHLLRIVPLVQGRVHIQSLVTLQSHQPGLDNRGQHLRVLRLPHPCRTCHQQAPSDAVAPEERGHQGTVGDVSLLAKSLLDGLDAIQYVPAPPLGQSGERKGRDRHDVPAPDLSALLCRGQNRTANPAAFAAPARYTPEPDGAGSRSRRTGPRSFPFPPPPGRPPPGSSPPSAFSPEAPAPPPPPGRPCRRRR